MYIPDGVVACRDVQCKDPAHRLEIDRYVVELLNNISESGHETIPVKESKPTKNDNSKSIAGWKDFVEPFQINAQFWYSIWLSAGKPINNELHRL